jgi:hypothetical protein
MVTTNQIQEQIRITRQANQDANRRQVAFQEVISEARDWEAVHNPFDRTTRLPLFQYVIEEGTGGALVPFRAPDQPQEPTLYLGPHAHDQLLSRLDFAKKTYDRLPEKLNIVNLNWLIQNYYTKDALLRCQDGNKIRALLTSDFEPFDNLELLNILEPFCQDAEVKYYFNDDATIHVSVIWPRTTEEVKVGDVVQRGIHISNSEIGVRSVTIAAFLYRLKCSNGMVGYDGGGIRRFRHVGDSGKLRDQVKAAIDETHLESTKILAQFKASIDKAIDAPIEYLERIAKDKTNDMTQEDFKAALDAFMLEPDGNLFGVTNAITRAAQWYRGEDKYHLERVGTKVLAEGLRK